MKIYWVILECVPERQGCTGDFLGTKVLWALFLFPFPSADSWMLMGATSNILHLPCYHHGLLCWSPVSPPNPTCLTQQVSLQSSSCPAIIGRNLWPEPAPLQSDCCPGEEWKITPHTSVLTVQQPSLLAGSAGKKPCLLVWMHLWQRD